MGNMLSDNRSIGDLDLVRAAKNELFFLRYVEKHKNHLYDPNCDYMQEAMRRYTQLWLPLIVERGNAGHKEALVGPLDVEWLSHTHRLCPTVYLKDLEAYGATAIPPHKLYDPVSYRHVVSTMSMTLWTVKYPDEPFELPLSFAAKKIDAEKEFLEVALPPLVVTTVEGRSEALALHIDKGNPENKRVKAEPKDNLDGSQTVNDERDDNKKDDEKESKEETNPIGEQITPASSTNSSMVDVRKRKSGPAAGDIAALEKALVDFVVEDVAKEDAGGAEGAETEGSRKKIKLEYDLAAAVRRQQMFYYQISHGEDEEDGDVGGEDGVDVAPDDDDEPDPPSRSSSSPGSDADYEIISHGDLNNGEKLSTAT